MDSGTTASPSQTPCPLMQLPRELRNIIYGYLIADDETTSVMPHAIIVPFDNPGAASQTQAARFATDSKDHKYLCFGLSKAIFGELSSIYEQRACKLRDIEDVQAYIHNFDFGNLIDGLLTPIDPSICTQEKLRVCPIVINLVFSSELAKTPFDQIEARLERWMDFRDAARQAGEHVSMYMSVDNDKIAHPVDFVRGFINDMVRKGCRGEEFQAVLVAIKVCFETVMTYRQWVGNKNEAKKARKAWAEALGVEHADEAELAKVAEEAERRKRARKKDDAAVGAGSNRKKTKEKPGLATTRTRRSHLPPPPPPPMDSPPQSSSRKRKSRAPTAESE